jgi:hypothetical protein
LTRGHGFRPKQDQGEWSGCRSQAACATGRPQKSEAVVLAPEPKATLCLGRYRPRARHRQTCARASPRPARGARPARTRMMALPLRSTASSAHRRHPSESLRAVKPTGAPDGPARVRATEAGERSPPTRRRGHRYQDAHRRRNVEGDQRGGHRCSLRRVPAARASASGDRACSTAASSGTTSWRTRANELSGSPPTGRNTTASAPA